MSIFWAWIALLVASPAAPPPPAAGTPATFYATATVEERPLDAAAGSVTVIEGATIEGSGARTVAELLRWAPGIVVSSAGTRGGFTTAAIRGGDPNFTLVLLDGVPLNDPTDPVGGAFNLEGLAAAAVERIEIVRGPLSSFYGSTGLAGVVNVIIRHGGADGGLAGRAEVEGGDAELRRGFASLGGGFGAGERDDYFLAVSREREAGRVADEDFAQLELGGNAGFAFDGGDLRLSGRLSDWRARDYPEASGGPRLGSGELRRSDHRELALGADLRLGTYPGAGPASRHRLSGAFYQHDLDRASPAIGFQVPESRESTRYRRGRLAWTTRALGGDDHSLHLGAEVEHEDARNDSLLLLPPFLGGAVAGDYRVERTTGGIFVERLERRGNLTLELGGRIDLPEGSDPELSPRLAAAFRPGGGATRLRVSLGRAFKLPSFFALASPPQLGGNPELVPETALGGDLGVEHARGPLRLAATVFWNRFDDLIDFDFATFTHLNRSQVEAFGMELDLTWSPAPWLELAGDVTWQEVEDRATGLPLRGRPEWSGNARLLLRPRERYDLWLDLQHVGRRRDEQIPVPERDVAPGYRLVGLAARWRPAPRWELYGRFDNLLDESYETLIGFPGPSRGFRLGVRYRSGG